MSDIRLQEIVTRAVVGRGDRRVVWSYTAPFEEADHVLGVHVGQVQLSVEDGDEEATLQVSATCDLWCSSGDETRVHRLAITHREPVKVRLNARVVGETETRANLVRGVRCLQAEVKDGQLKMKMEAEAGIEVIGLARFWVKAYDLADDLSSGAESGDFLSGSASSSSGVSDAFLADGSSGSATEASDDLEDLAILATSQPVAQPELVKPEWVDSEAEPVSVLPSREPLPQRRAAVISHFQQQTYGPSRISIVQGH